MTNHNVLIVNQSNSGHIRKRRGRLERKKVAYLKKEREREREKEREAGLQIFKFAFPSLFF